jgi:hypothetical protein
MAAEVLALTEQYLEVRYAGRSLSEADRREFARRVKELRQQTTEAPRPAAA